LKKNTFLTLLAGLCLVLPSYVAAPPGLTSPLVLVTILLQVALSWIGHGHWLDETYWNQAVMLTLPALLFFAWNPRLLLGQARTPKRTYVLIVLGVALGAVNLIVSWSYGVRWEGIGYTRLVSAESVLFMAILCVLFFRSWKDQPSFIWNLALHWVLFAWLAWFAFPYLGEPI
jgi:hypothetical protein